MNQEEIKTATRLVPVSSLSSTLPRVLHVQNPFLSKNLYIIESPAAFDILLKPWTIGRNLVRGARASSIEFLNVLYSISPEFRESTYNTVAEIVPLTGALYYGIAEAFEKVFDSALNRCFVGARRILKDEDWVTEFSYMNFEALPSKPVVLVGDTIATGGTIKKLLEMTLAERSDIRAMVVYSIAGGLKGALKLKELEEEMGIPLYIFFSNAIFGVEENGTDMPWLHPGTILSEERQKAVLEVYGEEIGRQFCCIWDWGERAKYPIKHLNTLSEEVARRLTRTSEPKSLEFLKKIQIKTEKALKKRAEYIHTKT